MPTESDNAGSDDQNLFENLCTGYVPAPLHKDLTRFNRLLHEMENSRADDLARLFSTAKSPIATGQIRDKDEVSSASVLSALQKDNEKNAHIQHKERLWQARLLLKLAETLDKRENEVRRGLARVSSDEQKNFASLEGISEPKLKNHTQFPGLKKLTHLGREVNYPEDYSAGASAMLLLLRTKAWAELFLADPSPNRPCAIVTTSLDSGSILLDRHENTYRKPPQKLFSLSIPTFPSLGSSESTNEQYISSRNNLRLAARENLKYFENFLRQAAALQETSSDKYPELNIQPEHIDDWEEKIKLEFPNPATGHQKLDFYCFPGIPTAVLFQKIFNLEPTITVNEQKYTTGILAILHT